MCVAKKKTNLPDGQKKRIAYMTYKINKGNKDLPMSEKNKRGRPRQEYQTEPKKSAEVKCNHCGTRQKRRIRYTKNGAGYHYCTGCGVWIKFVPQE